MILNVEGASTSVDSGELKLLIHDLPQSVGLGPGLAKTRFERLS